jgi:hypothetical protein
VVGGAHVRRRDDAQPTASLAQVEQCLLEHTEALPFDEGAEQVDVVRRSQFARDFVSDAGLAAAVDEQRAGGQRGGWALRK